MAKSIHVVYGKDESRWNIKQGGVTIEHNRTKKEAVDNARVISKVRQTELTIHNKDGKISKKDSHGGDPFPPRG